MRRGTNPGKLSHELPEFRRHRVIVPVHIPNQEGHNRHALEILQLCLESLCLTTAGRASITVISHGSIREANALTMSFFDEGRIDQLVLHDPDALAAATSVVHGRFEPLLTVSDARVLFLPGWLEAVEEVFRRFPEAGIVTPTPDPAAGFSHTTATILGALGRGELRHVPVDRRRQREVSARPRGEPENVLSEEPVTQMAVTRRGFAACVGGGHFVFTLRREVADRMPAGAWRPALERGADARPDFDEPPDALGVWRLSTTRAYARHMGSVPEPWMYDEISRTDFPQVSEPPTGGSLPPLRPSRIRHIPLTWRRRALSALRKVVLRANSTPMPRPSAS